MIGVGGNGGRDSEYRKQRARLLKGNPLCHWCRERVATTADHVPALAEFPDPALWVGVLVPACLKCNSSRGQRLAQARKVKPKRSRSW